MGKERADKLLVEKGYINSRSKAKKIILDGIVYIGGKRIKKPSQSVLRDSNIDIRENPLSFVSRAGTKLEKALDEFNINLSGLVALDIGSSTGGFTQCMLEDGARFVYALDVGKDQLVEELKEDSRVFSMEGTNIRDVSKEDFDLDINFISIDVSFISLKLVLPVAKDVLENNGQIVALIKPQFEVGKGNISKKGIVKDRKLHYGVLRDIIDFSSGLGLGVNDLTYSPVTGSKGNIEFLIFLESNSKGKNISDDYIYNLLEKAYRI